MSGSVNLTHGHIDRPTHFDRIKKMSLCEFASEILVVEMRNLLPVTFFCALPLNKFYDSKDEAVNDVIKWLESEVETE